MKSEGEIRKHRDDLRVALKRPCDCAGTGHALECQIGGRMMKATIETLSWILDENPELDRMVKVFAAGARRL